MGTKLLRIGFLGATTRYQAREMTPPLAEATRTFAQAAAEGVRTGLDRAPGATHAPDAAQLHARLAALTTLYQRGDITVTE